MTTNVAGIKSTLFICTIRLIIQLTAAKTIPSHRIMDV